MKFKAVLFDLDGTLINSIVDIADSMNVVLKKRKFPEHSINEYMKFIGNGIIELVISSLPQNKRDKKTVEECEKEMREIYAEKWLQKTYIYKGIPELLDELTKRNYKLAILSNKPHKYTKKIVEILFDKWNFDIVFGAKNGVAKKPDPVLAFEISKILNISCEQFIYVGDSATDMQTAINSGMYPVGVSWGYKSIKEIKESGAKKIISNPLELLDIF
ncbi:MAG: HAD family hydrolase [Bacteroidota bacterium]|nr:HAD family hydrolase [Bacteroidota bacterium]